MEQRRGNVVEFSDASRLSSDSEESGESEVEEPNEVDLRSIGFFFIEMTIGGHIQCTQLMIHQKRNFWAPQSSNMCTRECLQFYCSFIYFGHHECGMDFSQNQLLRNKRR